MQPDHERPDHLDQQIQVFPINNTASSVKQFAKMELAGLRFTVLGRHSQPLHLSTTASNGVSRRMVVMALDKDGVEAVSQGIEPQRQEFGGEGLVGRVVAFTTPLQYAPRFDNLLREKGAEPLWCPTIVTEQSEQTRQELEVQLQRFKSRELEVHGVAFTSRAGIRAFADVFSDRQIPWNPRALWEDMTGDPNKSFIVAALGKDAELLNELNVIADSPQVTMVVPQTSTPQALVEALGKGFGRRILCPVPLVEGLEEPPVVPQFLQELRRQGWDPVRVNSYVTRWLGRDCAKELLVKDQEEPQFRSIDALVFTSTAEIEGLLKSFRSLGQDGVEALKERSRKFLVACHGPVTAMGAERLGVEVDVVGKEFQSFAGVIKELEAEFQKRCGQ